MAFDEGFRSIRRDLLRQDPIGGWMSGKRVQQHLRSVRGEPEYCEEPGLSGATWMAEIEKIIRDLLELHEPLTG